MNNQNVHGTVVIVGGGIIGSFVGFFLRNLGSKARIVVIEKDSTYQFSSTALSAASIRTQFGCDFNLKMSLFGAAMFRDIKTWFGPDADIGFHERGYLILGSPASAEDMRADAQRQNALGAQIESLDAVQLRSRYPWINVDDIGVANFGLRNEGWFDAWALLQLVRSRARALGVEYVNGEVTRIDVASGRVTGVRIGSETRIEADWCVNAAGASSADIAALLGIELPVRPRKRTVFHVKAPVAGEGFPMVFDNSGVWIRPEGDGFIAGIGPEEHEDPDAHGDFEPHHDLFESSLWPKLANRIPAMESLRLLRAWAGHYEMNLLDHNGVVGPHHEIPNFLFATGFSGHGVMHAPATGQAIAERIHLGEYRTLDLSPLGYERIRDNRPILETIVY